MRILYFTQFYAPESIAAAFRAKDHAAAWVDGGHEVVVFTGWPNYPAGRLYDGYVMERLGEEVVDGVRVFRSRSKLRPNTSFRKRIESGLSFIWNGLRNTRGRSPVGKDYDAVLVTSGTVFAAWLGVHYAKKNRLPPVVEFRDLTYRQMVATGSSEGCAKVRAMKALELSFCKAADEVVVLTEGFRQELAAQGIPERKMVVVPNGADPVPCEHDWTGALHLGYFGTMGISQDVVRTLDLAAGLAEEGLIGGYELIGEGAARGAVEEGIASGAYPFATISRGVSQEELEPRYAAVHMTVASLQDSESFAGTIPSKIFQSFARGVPVLFVGPEGEAARLVCESGGGMALCGSDAECAAALRAFAKAPGLPARLAEMSSRARSFMERDYTRGRMAECMLGVLEDAVGGFRRDE
ncbi:MAG TPA: glycosyltransferase family 4 protein [Rubneribacter badeniensis]|uniref:Glycosyltransferase family 4 protein n=1 Tax=Rubneribacter badeniensis TaxID=2070688 RepID=A0A9D2VKW4_9ACTN|nr:glycosyltransferase family 4 protein [Rubneribacter badeniensis]